MSMGMLILVVNAIMWWLLFTREGASGLKFLFLLLAIGNSWVALGRMGVFGTDMERRSVSSTIDQISNATPTLHVSRVK